VNARESVERRAKIERLEVTCVRHPVRGSALSSPTRAGTVQRKKNMHVTKLKVLAWQAYIACA
jgi:hypothetical protein